MTTVEVAAKLTVDDLVDAVDQLPNTELSHFVRRVLVLQARRGLAVLGEDDEQALLDAIQGRQLSESEHKRLARLRAKSRSGALTPAEHAELLQFVQRVEQADLRRVEALVELAKKRGVSWESHD
jgi:hypothetical protein